MKVLNHLTYEYLRMLKAASDRVNGIRILLLIGLAIFVVLVIMLWWKKITEQIESDIKDFKKIIMNIPLTLIWANRNIRDRI